MRALLALLLMLTVSCAATAPAPSSTGSATNDVVADVNQLLQARRSAIGQRDLAAFERTFDPSRPSFAACQREEYDLGTQRSLGVRKVDTYGDYYRIIADYPGGAVRLFARRSDGVLRLTEPQPNEIGESRTRIDGPITVRYWAIDESVSEGVAIAAHHAYDLAVSQTTTVPQADFSVQLYPVHLFMSSAPCWIAGTSSSTNPAQPVVSLPVWNVTFDTAFKVPTVATYDVLSHEALHWIQGQVSFVSVAVAPWWMLEGWPDRVAAIDRSGIVRGALCRSGFPAREALERHGIALLEKPGTLAAGAQYAAANTMVEYLFATYGRQRYWELFAGAGTYIDNDRAFRAVLGIGQAEFYDAWLAWVKAKYC